MDPGFDGLYGVGSGHGGAAREIISSTPNFAVAQSLQHRKFVIYTHVDHFDVDAIMPRQYVYGGAAAQKVIRHLSGDIFRIRTDTLFGNPVVRSENKQELSPEPRWNFSLNHGHTPGQLFEFAQTPLRFR
jgi:hypothetical protein